MLVASGKICQTIDANTPPKTNMDTQMMVWKSVTPALHVAMFGTVYKC